ncbi:hypothetical protein [Micromonospora sp. 067-2]|uniref:hypothetical protein n=1 Tax=Micromonospora sp. 067-2 TaxID=2789270 RepID=UPI00397D2BA9
MTSRPTTTPSAPASSWRITWADRENERRRRAYRSDVDVWLRHDDHLTRLRIEAVGFLGCTRPRTGLPVDLDDDELVFRVLPAAELVEAEARHVAGLPTPGALTCVDAPGDTLPDGLRAVDAGMAVVTSHRVAFAGRHLRREWRYANLSGFAHHPDVALTLLHTTDRGPLAGLLVPVTAAVNARFYLTLAAAVSAGERAAVVAQLDVLLSDHRNARPTPLPLVEPDEAPLTAVRPDRRATAITALAGVMFATLTAGALGPERAGLPHRAEAGTIATSAGVPGLPGDPVAPHRGTSTAGGAAVRIAADVPSRGSSGRPVIPAAASGSSDATVPPTAPVRTVALPPPASATPGPAPTSGPPLPSASASPTVSASPTAPASPSVSPSASPSPSLHPLTLCLDAFQRPVPCVS